MEKEIAKLFDSLLNAVLGSGESWTRLLGFGWVGLSFQVPGNEDIVFVCETEEEMEREMEREMKRFLDVLTLLISSLCPVKLIASLRPVGWYLRKRERRIVAALVEVEGRGGGRGCGGGRERTGGAVAG